ncbi:MAG: hypothetical protein KC729_00475, partial [Candidatus Eisenbacteria bacterium]|nr:hypothetical protein [Candidatus Eisenbacteria bacterium]
MEPTGRRHSLRALRSIGMLGAVALATVVTVFPSIVRSSPVPTATTTAAATFGTCADSTFGSDDDWSDEFFIPGPNSPGRFPSVDVIVPFRDELVVVGRFTHVGSQAADGWAAWDGERWRAIDHPFGL